MNSAYASAALVRSPGGIQAQRPVGSATDYLAVVIVLAVVFPVALVAAVIAAALGEGRVTGASASPGVRYGCSDVPEDAAAVDGFRWPLSSSRCIPSFMCSRRRLTAPSVSPAVIASASVRCSFTRWSIDR